MEHGHFDNEGWRSPDAGEMISKGCWKCCFRALPAVSHLTPGCLGGGSPRPKGPSEPHSTPPSQEVSVYVSRIVRRNSNHTSQTLELKQIILVMA